MYIVDLYKVYKLLHRYNITILVAVKYDKDTDKLVYYSGFKTLKVPVINTRTQRVEEYTFNKICNAVKRGKQLYPLSYIINKGISIKNTSDYDMGLACMYALKKGIYYADYFVFLTEQENALGLIKDNSLYLYPVKLINNKNIDMIHLEEKRIYIRTKIWVQSIISELDLDIEKDIMIPDYFFANINNYKEKTIKDINALINVKMQFINSIKVK